MNCTLTKASLVKTFTSVALFAGSRAGNDSITFKVEGDCLYIISRGVDYAIQSKTGLTSQIEEGSASVSCKLFLKIIKELAGESVELIVADSKLTINSLSQSWKIPVSVYLDDKLNEGSSVTTIDSATFSKSLNTVKHAVDTEGRNYLMMVDVKEGRFRASDGTQYHEARSTNRNLNFSIAGFIVEPLLKLLNSVKWKDSEVTVLNSDGYYQFRCGSDLLSLKHLNSQFPDLDGILVRPLRSQVPALLQLSKSDFVKSLKKVKAVCTSDKPIVVISIENHEITLSSSENESEAKVTLPAIWAARERRASFHINQLMQLLETCETDEIELRFGQDTRDRKSPVVLEGEGKWAMLNQTRV